MAIVEKDNCAKIAEALNKIDVKRLNRLAKHDGDFKSILKLVDACRSLVHGKDSRSKISWLKVAHALHEKIMSHDPQHINLIDERRNLVDKRGRKDRTWCMWLRWDAMTERGTMSGYSLVSEHANSLMHEDAAKSFVENFCDVGPDCLRIYNSPYTAERQRLANTAIVAVYKELGCPKTPEDVRAKLFASK